MPPQTRGNKTSKTSKENSGVLPKTKSKPVGKTSRPRKALADKTNSASDDTSSTDVPKNAVVTKKTKVVESIAESKSRPRRERKLPNKYNENVLLTNLSNNKIDEVNGDSSKNDSNISSPFKTPQKNNDNSLIVNRPKRVCRLPSKFDDHSISPHKFIPVGCHASTPMIQNKSKPINVEVKAASKNKTVKGTSSKAIYISKKSPSKKQTEVPSSKGISDSNNNPKHRQLRQKKLDTKNQPQISLEKTHNQENVGKKLLQKSFSFRILEDKSKPAKRDSSHLDVYEFTYDPNEEPPPQKKKRKRTVKRKPTKPKTVTFKYNYDHNVSKALAALKNVVAKKSEPQLSKPVGNQVFGQTTATSTVKAVVPSTSKAVAPNVIPTTASTLAPYVIPTTASTSTKPQQVVSLNQQTNVVMGSNVIAPTASISSELGVSHQLPKPNISIRVEDIAADFEPLMDHGDMDYSPVTSPYPAKSPRPTTIRDNDPLNLQDNLSFFDDVPVASSSMNMSVRRPHASPWRVQFEQLPIKWQVNTYIKPNMTPAVESSFISFNDSNKKKHVYTNIGPELQDALADLASNNQPNLIQTSIISFMKEAAERSARKKKRALSATPTKANSVFDDFSNISVATNRDVYRTPNKTPRREAVDNLDRTPNKTQEENLNKEGNENKENSGDDGKKKKKPPKSTDKDKDGTYFGFDESEDQENVSPVKIDNPRVRALRPCVRAVLQEVNAESGPTRAKIPLAAKTNVVASSDASNKVFDGIKSATDAPVFPEKNTNNDDAITNIDKQANLDNEDSQSVHLFEDIELVHHIKPHRKSYGKPKKVTFQQTVAEDSDTQSLDVPQRDAEASDEEDDLADLTFTMPNMAQKKVNKKKVTTKKKQLSKKEKAEMEAWAAQFNSMCEDVEEFPLVVE